MSKPTTFVDGKGGRLAATALFGLAVSGAFSAPASAGTTTTTMAVSADVTPNCSATSTPVAFGGVDVTSGLNIDAAGSIVVTCSNGLPWVASAGVGGGSGASFASRKMTSGANLLNYTLYTNTGRTIVWGDGAGGTTGTIGQTGTGSAQNATVYARIFSGQSSVLPGSYSDTVQVTVTY